MYEELVKRLREAPNDWPDADLHYEATNAIEELARRNEQFMYTPPPAWIPIAERLPKSDCSTLVCTESGKVCTARFYVATKKWNGYAGSSAKYWMPLPAPFKET